MGDNIEIPVIEYEKSNKDLINLRKDKLNLMTFKSNSLENFKNLENKRKLSIIARDKITKKIEELTKTFEKLQILLEQELSKKKKIELNIANFSETFKNQRENIEKLEKSSKKMDDEVNQKKEIEQKLQGFIK